MNFRSYPRSPYGGCTEITLNKPESRNAMSLAMVAELQQALQGAEDSRQTSWTPCASSCCAGLGAFLRGADLRDMASNARMRAMPRAVTTVSTPLPKSMPSSGACARRLPNSPLAIVAVLEGTVMGGGFRLACVADVAIASETARFRCPRPRWAWCRHRLPFLVERLGYSQSQAPGGDGGRLDAAAALAMGLVHQQVPTAPSCSPRWTSCWPTSWPARRAHQNQGVDGQGRLQAPPRWWMKPPPSSPAQPRAPRAWKAWGLHSETQTRMGTCMNFFKARMSTEHLGAGRFAQVKGGRAASGDTGAKRPAPRCAWRYSMFSKKS